MKRFRPGGLVWLRTTDQPTGWENEFLPAGKTLHLGILGLQRGNMVEARFAGNAEWFHPDNGSGKPAVVAAFDVMHLRHENRVFRPGQEAAPATQAEARHQIQVLRRAVQAALQRQPRSALANERLLFLKSRIQAVARTNRLKKEKRHGMARSNRKG